MWPFGRLVVFVALGCLVARGSLPFVAAPCAGCHSSNGKAHQDAECGSDKRLPVGRGACDAPVERHSGCFACTGCGAGRPLAVVATRVRGQSAELALFLAAVTVQRTVPVPPFLTAREGARTALPATHRTDTVVLLL